MQSIEQQAPEPSEQDLARRLREQVAAWRAMRPPARTRIANGVRVEWRSGRRSSRGRLSP